MTWEAFEEAFQADVGRGMGPGLGVMRVTGALGVSVTRGVGRVVVWCIL